MKPYRMKAGYLQCMMSSISSPEMMSRPWFPRPAEQNIIGTKWIFKNKTDEHGTVVQNKARLVA
jgi:hypothetical protein